MIATSSQSSWLVETSRTMPFLTPDDAPPLVRRGIFLPDSLEFHAVFKGLMLDLANPDNWQQYGDLTPEECAEIWVEAIELTDYESSCS